jgi:hypothetical protein
MLVGATTAEWMTAIGTIGAGGAAILALLGAAVTILDNRKTACRRTTHEYISRLLDPDLLPLEATMTAFLRGGMCPPGISRRRWRSMSPEARRDSAKALWRHLGRSSSLEDRRKLLEILAYPNLLEGLASMYNEGLLDRGMVKAQVEVDAQSFLRAGRWWIDQVREDGGDPNTFRDIEAMIQDLAKRKLPKWYASQSSNLSP